MQPPLKAPTLGSATQPSVTVGTSGICDEVSPDSIHNYTSRPCGKISSRASLPSLLVEGVRPFVTTVRTLKLASGGQSKLIDRLLRVSKTETGWLEFYRIGGPGRETLIWTDSAERALQRIFVRGELPPPLPSEISHLKKRRLPSGSAGGGNPTKKNP